MYQDELGIRVAPAPRGYTKRKIIAKKYVGDEWKYTCESVDNPNDVIVVEGDDIK